MSDYDDTLAVLEDLYMETVGDVPTIPRRVRAEELLLAVADKAPQHLPTLLLLAEVLDVPPIAFDSQLRRAALEMANAISSLTDRSHLIIAEGPGHYTRKSGGVDDIIHVWLNGDRLTISPPSMSVLQYSFSAWRDRGEIVRIPIKYDVSASHIDTCFSDYLQDHHTRDGEMLLGVPLFEGMTATDLVDGLLNEVSSFMDAGVPEEVDNDQLRAAFTEAVDPRHAWGLEEIWTEEEIAANDEDGETPSHWFVLRWSRVDEDDE